MLKQCPPVFIPGLTNVFESPRVCIDRMRVRGEKMQSRSVTISSVVVSPAVVSPADIPPRAMPVVAFANRQPVNRVLPVVLLAFFFAPLDSSRAGQNQTLPAHSPTHSNQKTGNSDTLYFGLLPYLSTTALIKTWRPFANLIEKTLHKKVIIKTAPNFRTFIQRTAEGRYDLLMTAPHFASLAIKTHGYQIIAGHSNDLVGDIVVAKNARFQSINDLRGEVFVTPDPLAAVSILAELTLKQYGLTPNKDIRIKATASHNTALVDVAEGRAAAAVAVGGLYRRLNASNKFGQLRKLATTDKIPHIMYIANPTFSKNDLRKLQKALINPTPGTPGAKAITLLKNQFNGGNISIVTPQKLNQLAPILSLLETKINQE